MPSSFSAFTGMSALTVQVDWTVKNVPTLPLLTVLRDTVHGNVDHVNVDAPL